MVDAVRAAPAAKPQRTPSLLEAARKEDFNAVKIQLLAIEQRAGRKALTPPRAKTILRDLPEVIALAEEADDVFFLLALLRAIAKLVCLYDGSDAEHANRLALRVGKALQRIKSESDTTEPTPPQTTPATPPGLVTPATPWSGGVSAAEPIVAPPPGPVEQRIDSVIARLSPTYEVPDGQGGRLDVQAPSAFRIIGGINQETQQEAMNKIRVALWPILSMGGARANALTVAMMNSSMGRGTPEHIQKLTQALIEMDQLSQFVTMTPPDYTLAIRRMQWHFGVGVDCSGAMRPVFRELFGAEITANRGDVLIHTGANARSLNPAVKKVEREEIKAGDIIALEDKGDDFGHYVVVRARYTAPNPDGGTYDIFDVFSSWGAGGDADLKSGGVNQRRWAFDPATSLWGEVYEDHTISWGDSLGPYNHLYKGAYRSVYPVR